MGEQSKLEREVIHPEVELLPPDHFEPRFPGAGARVWLSGDSGTGTRRVYVAKLGPLTTIILTLAFAALLIVACLVAIGFFVILVGVSAVVVLGSLAYGLVRAGLMRVHSQVDPDKRGKP